MQRTRSGHQRTSGFTLIELLIVVSVIAILVTIAVPNLLRSKVNANHTATIATLRAIATAQFKFKTMNLVDLNYDSAAEYGSFAEMTGKEFLRGSGGDKLAPNLLSIPFAQMDADGRVPKHGYHLALYLPDASGVGIREKPGSGMAGVDPLLAADYWTCVAWPMEHEATGKYTFFVNQQGDILKTKAKYNGKTLEPPAGCALLGVSADRINSQGIAANQIGADGNEWLIAN